MRLRKIDRYLLLLATFFVLAILRTRDLPGEEVVADLYRAAIFRPLLAQAAGSLAKDELELVRLRSELESARRDVTRLREELLHTRELRGYFEELQWDAIPRAKPGSVITVDADLFRRAFDIDLGQVDGIRVGLPVVTGRALLGLVRHVENTYSHVMRVDDPTFRIEVEIETEAGPLACVAQGNGDRSLVLKLVRGARGLKPGLPVFTSSYHLLVPPGLLVGMIESVGDENHNGLCDIRLLPAASLLRLAQVEVLERR